MFRCSYNSSFSLMNVQEEMYVVGVILDLWLRCSLIYDVCYYQVWYYNFLLPGISSRLCNLNIDEICKLKIWAKKMKCKLEWSCYVVWCKLWLKIKCHKALWLQNQCHRRMTWTYKRHKTWFKAHGFWHIFLSCWWHKGWYATKIPYIMT